MNINLDKSTFYPSFPSQLYDDPASPYLSPLICNNSPFISFVDQNIPSFSLQDQNSAILNFDNIPEVKESSSDEPRDLSIQEEKEENVKTETIIVKSLNKSSRSIVQEIVEIIVENSDMKETDLKIIGEQLYENSKQLRYTFQTLMIKFKKLKKTKQEMTKFCMRKAFKFISENKKATKKQIPSKDQLESEELYNCGFELPFKKNSSQKTINSQFLKQLFHKVEFVEEYKKFLQHVHSIIMDDNQNKILYLSNIIEGHLAKNQIFKLEGIKRLPWTGTILKKTESLARSLIEYSELEQENITTLI